MFQRGRDCKNSGTLREEVDSINEPVIRPLRSKAAFIPGQEKRCSRRAICGFDLYQFFLTRQAEREDIVACTISIVGRYPPDSPREISALGLFQLASFQIYDESLTCLAKRAVAMVAFNRVEFGDEALQSLW